MFSKKFKKGRPPFCQMCILSRDALVFDCILCNVLKFFEAYMYTCTVSVSYTHLDVYKRQVEQRYEADPIFI